MNYKTTCISLLMVAALAPLASADIFNAPDGYVFDAAHQHPNDSVNIYGTPISVSMVSGGEIGSIVTVAGTATFTMNGGTLGSYIETMETSHFVMNGGTATSYVHAAMSSTIDIYGGTFDSYINADGTSTINIYGGLFDLLHRTTSGNFNIYGYDLVRNGGTITGFLADGTPLNASYVEIFPHTDGQLNLITVPEPSAFTLMALGLGAIFWRRSAKRQPHAA